MTSDYAGEKSKNNGQLEKNTSKEEKERITPKEIQTVAIGIDLGTTYSCVAVYRNNQVEIIPNDIGERTTPSYVGFNSEERLIGAAAKNQSSRNPKNTIFDVKRLMGKKFSYPDVQEDMKHFPFKVVEGGDGSACVEVKYMDKKETFRPQEISAAVLIKMKEIAESYLGHEVNQAIITVPAYFDDSQRRSTIEAGKIAGLQVLRILNEPTAAALAYASENDFDNSRTALVIDIGGGTSDLSLLDINKDVIEVIAISGNSHFGGGDFDNRLVDYCADIFEKETHLDIRGKSKPLRKLKTACEQAKKALSISHRTSIEIDSLFGGEDLYLNLSRAKLESLCDKDFAKLHSLIEKVLQDGKTGKKDVNQIILVGGSTRIPKIQNIISTFFNGKKLNKSLHPDEAIAYGAALCAYNIVRPIDNEENPTLLLDVIPLSLGIETSGGIMTTIIPRNSTKPVSQSQIFSTYEDNQDAVTVRVYEGEREFVKDNNRLAKFNLRGIPPAPRGTPKIEVIFNVDVNGILNVTARDKATDNNITLKIESDEHLSVDQIEEMVQKSKEMAGEDKKRKMLIEISDRIENLIYNIKKCISNDKMKLSSDDKYELNELVNDIENWLENHDINNTSIEDFREKKQEIEIFTNPIMARAYERAEEDEDNNNNDCIEFN